MSSLIISERNRLKNEEREINGYIRINSNAILRLRGATAHVEHNKARIEKLKADNTGLSQRLQDISGRLEQLARGELTSELRAKARKDTEESDKKFKQKRAAKIDEAKIKAQQSKESRAYYERSRASARKERYEKRSADRGYSYFLRVISTIPQYMRCNLETMPNNKGYIWRGVQLFGKQPDEGTGEYILFEKQKGVLVIHKWTNNWLEYSKSTKPRNGKAIKLLTETFEKRDHKRILRDRKIHSPPKPRTGRSGSRSRNRNHHHHRRGPSPALVSMTPDEKRRLTRQTKRNDAGVMKKKMPRPRGRGRTGNPKQHRNRGLQRRPTARASGRTNGTDAPGGPSQAPPEGKGRGRGRHRTLPAWMTKKKSTVG
jgi:hypothetical protein